MEIATIYTISDGNIGSVIYVGATVGALKSRLSTHISEGRLPFTRDGNVSPCIDRIEGVDEDDAADAERYWIEQFRQWGYPLQNSRVNKGFPRQVLSGLGPVVKIPAAKTYWALVKDVFARNLRIKAGNESQYMVRLANAMCQVLKITGDPRPRLSISEDQRKQLENLIRSFKNL